MMARARITDPFTSHKAAESVENVTKTQGFIVQALKTPRTDEELIMKYRSYRYAPQASDSGIRTRRAELVAMGWVVDTGQRRTTQSGRQSIVWGLCG